MSDLAVFNLDIIYRPGKSNANADSLSRVTKVEVSKVFDATVGNTHNDETKFESKSKSNMEQSQEKDKQINQLTAILRVMSLHKFPQMSPPLYQKMKQLVRPVHQVQIMLFLRISRMILIFVG